METVGKLAQDVLSEVRLRSQGNTTISDECLNCGRSVSVDGSRCVECAARHTKEIAAEETRWAIALGGMRAYKDYTFERFLLTPQNRKAIEAAKAFNCKTDNLFIYGPTGSGKTHLAAATARKYLGTGYVTTLKHSELSREVRSADGANQEVRVIESYVVAHVMVLDDLGIAKDTEFAVSLLYEVVDGRYMGGRGGLIVTSNLSLGDLASKLGDDRVPSRLAEMCKVLSLVGEPDHRVGPR